MLNISRLVLSHVTLQATAVLSAKSWWASPSADQPASARMLSGSRDLSQLASVAAPVPEAEALQRYFNAHPVPGQTFRLAATFHDHWLIRPLVTSGTACCGSVIVARQLASVLRVHLHSCHGMRSTCTLPPPRAMQRHVVRFVSYFTRASSACG